MQCLGALPTEFGNSGQRVFLLQMRWKVWAICPNSSRKSGSKMTILFSVCFRVDFGSIARRDLKLALNQLKNNQKSDSKLTPLRGGVGRGGMSLGRWAVAENLRRYVMACFAPTGPHKNSEELKSLALTVFEPKIQEHSQCRANFP